MDCRAIYACAARAHMKKSPPRQPKMKNVIFFSKHGLQEKLSFKLLLIG